MSFYIPILIVVASNTIYHICSKSTPANVNTFASLSATYAVATVGSLILFFVTHKGTGLFTEYKQLNWSSFVLGIAIIGLEAGFLLMYRAGWNISTGQLFSSAVLAVVLLFVGWIFFKEGISFKKAAGMVICLVGLYLLKS